MYMNPTTLQQPLFALPRQSILGCDHLVNAADGVWIHVYCENQMMVSPKDAKGSNGESKEW